jgi:hypothetical protein
MKVRNRALVLAMVVVGVLAVLTVDYTSAAGLSDEINGDQFTRSSACGQCHKAIHDSWQHSMHALAAKDPIFQTALLQTMNVAGKPTILECLACHSPSFSHTEGPINLADIDIQEGVTCDYCHSVSGIDEDSVPALQAKPGVTKYGPEKDFDSPAHEVKYNPLFKKSEFCRGCHEYKVNGVAVMDTYNEWKESSYAAAGKQCQDCHMPYVDRNLVDPSVKKSMQKINLHEPAGGRSIEQLRNAAKIGIASATSNGKKHIVSVEVENIGAGHKLPTGMPTRYLVLEFTVKRTADGRTIHEDKYLFQRVLADKEGHVIKEDFRTMLDAASVVSDNRLAPGEKRVIPFKFFSTSKDFTYEARLNYVYEPYIISQEKISVEIDGVQGKVQ